MRTDVDKWKKKSPSYGYVIAASCFSLQAIGVGTFISYGVFINPLIAEFGWSRATLSGASSVAFFLMGLLGILAGRLNDNVGPRVIVLVTGCFFGLGHVIASRIGTVWQLYLFYGIVVGIGLSSVDVIALSTTARWFIRKRGLMTGIVKVGTGFGQFIIPLVASVLISNRGWRNSFIIMGGASLILILAIGLLLKRDPHQATLQAGCDTEISKGASKVVCKDLSLQDVLHTKTFWTICAANLASLFCLMTVMVHVVPHAREIMDSPTKAAGILSTIGGVSMAGRVLTGFVLDRIGTKRSMIFCFVLFTVVLLWLQVADEPWMLYLFAVFYGMAHGGFFTIISPIVADFFGLRIHGVLFGIVVFSGTVGGAIGPFVSGYIFDMTGAYHMAFRVCTLMSLMGLVLMLSLKPVEAVE